MVLILRGERNITAVVSHLCISVDQTYNAVGDEASAG